MWKPPRSVLAVSAVMLALRVVWVLRFREIDSDAYGHFFIAIATRNDPKNLAVHWVWLPLYHFVVGGLSALGLSFRGLRLVNAVLATAGPLLLWDAVRRRLGEDEARIAAIALALAPLTMMLGQSAQPETVFVVLLIASVQSAASDRPVRAGVLLAVACMIRYEAWGAALALAICWAWRRKLPFSLVAIPVAVVAAYVAFRWWTDGRLLLFFRGTRDITKVQVAREAWTLRALIDFPIVLPFVVIGPAIALVPVGFRRAFGSARDAVVPGGLAGFLLISYYTGASHSGERYLASLVPFACIAIAAAAVRLRRPRVATFVFVLMAATTGWHLWRAASLATKWEPALREREVELARLSGSGL